MPQESTRGTEAESASHVFRAVWWSSRSKFLLCTFVLVLALLPALAAAGSPSYQAEVHPRVWQALADEGEADILVVLRAQADLGGAAALASKEAKGRYVYERLWAVAQQTQRGLRALLDAQQASYRSFYIVNAVEVRADRALVQVLAARPEVGRIVPNPPVRGLPPDLPRTITEPISASSASAAAGIEPNLIRVHADDVWALGYTGQGIVVGGHDTGYDWDHPALRNQYRGWNGTTADHDYSWHDAIHSGGGECGPDSPEPCDDHGHGTHTMGIMVGDDGEGHRIGMAPGARWIGCRNMDVGVGTPATYIECFEFFLAPYPVGSTFADGLPELAPDVVDNSWACPPDEGCDADSLEASVEALRQAGIVVVVAAGNYGSACDTVIYPPAIYPQSLTVGNFDHTTDLIYSSSSRGPVTCDGSTYTKPDLTAPGTRIYSSLRDGAYGALTGTSMSAPHVAGAVALLLSAAPGLAGEVEAIENLLTRTAEPRTTTQGCGGDGPADVPNNTWGWGILDSLAAVREATVGTLGGTVTDGSSGLALAGVEVTAVPAAGPGVGATVVTSPSGTYTLTLAAGGYEVTAQAAGYVPQTMPQVMVVRGESTTLDLALVPWVRLYLPLAIKGF